MKNYSILLSKYCLLVFACFYSFTIYSQNYRVVSQGNKTFVIEQNNLSLTKIIPVTGSSFLNDSKKVQQNNQDNINSLNWVLQFTSPGHVFHDISFANPQVGYICSELGYVFKTTNGGNNWTQVLGLGFPWYWYGVYALTTDTVIVAGFNDQANVHSGVMRWTFNGGTTWTNDISVSVPAGVGWLTRVHFFDRNTGIVSNEFSGGVYYTTNGGKDSASWNYVLVNSDQGWFAGNIDADANGNIYTTGIHFAHTTNYGLNWASGPSADGTFDGGVDFMDANLQKGMTGGGQISNPVSGWIHKTTDGGQTWSARLYTFPYPVRAVKYFSDTLALAFIGNLYNEAGGVYSSTNAGSTWNQDISTAAEMFSYDYKLISNDSIDIWTVGSTGPGTGFIGKCYKARTGNPVGIKNSGIQISHTFSVFQNYPNPFNPATVISYELPVRSNVSLVVYNILGERVSELVNEKQNAGSYKITWNASNYPSGVYFYKLTAGNDSEVKKMLLVK